MDHISLVSCSLAFLLYSNTLKSGFVYDDRRAILTNPDLIPRTPWKNLFFNDFWGTPLKDSGSHGSYRPLSVLTFRLNYMINGFQPFGYHMVNILLHCSATYLLIKVVNLVLPKNKRRVGAIVSSLLFASHPIHTETVAGVVGRADLIAGNLFFLSLLCYIGHVYYRDNFKDIEVCHKRVKKYDKFTNTLEKSITCSYWHKYNLVFESAKFGEIITVCHKKNKWTFVTKVVKEWIYFGLSIFLSSAAMLGKETGITVLGVCLTFDYVFAKKSTAKALSQFYLVTILAGNFSILWNESYTKIGKVHREKRT